MTKYYQQNTPYFGTTVDRLLRATRGNDASYILVASPQGRSARQCLVARYAVGAMETESGGCIANSIITKVMLAVIISLIVTRFSMALLFQWVIARRLVKPGGRSNWLAWRSIRGGNDDPANHTPGPYNNYIPMNPIPNPYRGSTATLGSLSSARGASPSPNSSLVDSDCHPPSDIVQKELYTCMLVTCYSEGEEGLRTTMDSLAETTYSKKHKVPKMDYFFTPAVELLSSRVDIDILRDC